ncbi:MAG: hypothetical protein U0270_17525 [Labilithrix sp.]
MRSLLVAGLLGLVVGCVSSTHEGVGESNDALALDRVALPTLRTTLKAGDPYSPFSDERPIAIGGQTCLDAPRVELTPGTTEISASLVASRRDLMNRLDLGVEGVPINIAKLAGATGTARLAVDTELNERSLNLMFQAKGTYESALVGVGASPPDFDAAHVGECGWGYVNRAYHRLSAIVLVTVEAADGTSRVRLGCGEGEDRCTPTSVAAGPIKVQAALETMLKSGRYSVRVRSVADVIPGLPTTPLGDMVTMSASPDTAAEVISKLGNALNWLGSAQTAISKTLDDIRTSPADHAPAPTIKVDFTYWPGLSASLRERAADTYDRISALRTDYDLVVQRTDTWNTFDDDLANGFGHMYQTPAAPVATKDALATRGREARVVLDTRRHDLERRLDDCDLAAHNERDVNDAVALVGALETACRPLPALTWEPRWDVRRFAPIAVATKPYDEWHDHMCPEGLRIPKPEEASLLAPWSFEASLWVTREWFGANPLYLSKGKVERVGLFQAPSYVTACFDASAPSLFD